MANDNNGSNSSDKSLSILMTPIPLPDLSSFKICDQNTKYLPYTLNKERALKKKEGHCLRQQGIQLCRKAAGNLYFVLSTCNFEAFFHVLEKVLNEQPDLEADFTTNKDGATNTVAETIRVYDPNQMSQSRSRSNKESRLHLYTINKYRSSSTALINGRHYLRFEREILPILLLSLERHKLEIETMDKKVMQLLRSTRINSDTCQSPSSTTVISVSHVQAGGGVSVKVPNLSDNTACGSSDTDFSLTSLGNDNPFPVRSITTVSLPSSPQQSITSPDFEKTISLSHIQADNNIDVKISNLQNNIACDSSHTDFSLTSLGNDSSLLVSSLTTVSPPSPSEESIVFPDFEKTIDTVIEDLLSSVVGITSTPYNPMGSEPPTDHPIPSVVSLPSHRSMVPHRELSRSGKSANGYSMIALLPDTIPTPPLSIVAPLPLLYPYPILSSVKETVEAVLEDLLSSVISNSSGTSFSVMPSLDNLGEDETHFLTDSPAAEAWASTFSDSAETHFLTESPAAKAWTSTFSDSAETQFFTESPAAKAWASTFSDSAIATSVVEELVSSVTRASSMYTTGESFSPNTNTTFPDPVASTKNNLPLYDAISDDRDDQPCMNFPNISLPSGSKKDINNSKIRAKKAKKKFLAETFLLKTELNETKDQLLKQKLENDSLTAVIESLKETNNLLENRISAKNDECHSNKESLKQCQKVIDNKDGDIMSLKNKILNFDDDREKLQAEIALLKKQLKNTLHPKSFLTNLTSSNESDHTYAMPAQGNVSENPFKSPLSSGTRKNNCKELELASNLQSIRNTLSKSGSKNNNKQQ